MSRNFYIPFYTSEFLSGVSGMTAATRGVYITLLCMMYEKEAPLPQAWDIIARRCGCTLPALKKAIEALIDDEKIVLIDGQIWSPKCDKHIALRRERSDSAKAAAEKRWEKSEQNQGEGDADALPTQCYIKVKDKEERKKDTSYPKKESLPDPNFDLFWQVYPRRVARPKAVSAWRSAVRKALPDQIIDAARRYAAASAGKDAQYIAHPTSWLNAERWLDEAAPSRRWASDADEIKHKTEETLRRIMQSC